MRGKCASASRTGFVSQRGFIIVIAIIVIMIIIHIQNNIIIIVLTSINRKVPSHQPPSMRGKTWCGSLVEAHLDQDALLAERGAAFFARLWLIPRPCFPASALDRSTSPLPRASPRNRLRQLSDRHAQDCCPLARALSLHRQHAQHKHMTASQP